MFEDQRLALTVAIGTALVFIAVLVGTVGGPSEQEPGTGFAGSGLRISGGWVAESLGESNTAAAYLVIDNGGAVDDRLVGAAAAEIPVTELHMNLNEGGINRMRPVDGIPLPAGKAVSLEPGGFHIMLLQVPNALMAGDVVSVTLSFRNAPPQTVELPVRGRAWRQGNEASAGDPERDADGS